MSSFYTLQNVMRQHDFGRLFSLIMDLHSSCYSLNKKEWICSIFKEWILEKSEIIVNLEWIWSEHLLFTHFGVTTGITQGFRVIAEVTPKWVNNTNVHSIFTLISICSKIHSLKSEHIHSFLFREYRYHWKSRLFASFLLMPYLLLWGGGV